MEGRILARLFRVIAAGAAVITALVTGGSALSSETQAYTYDAKGRLIVKKSTGTANNNQTHSYCYDKAGNRVTYDSNATGTPDACVTDGTP
jgi:YD repeat-containing protein